MCSLNERQKIKSFETGLGRLKNFEEAFRALLDQHKTMIDEDPSAIESCKRVQEEYIEQVLIGSEERERGDIRSKADELIGEYFPESLEDE